MYAHSIVIHSFTHFILKKKNLFRDFICQALLSTWSIMVKTDMAPPHYNFKYDGDGGASKKTHINGKF